MTALIMLAIGAWPKTLATSMANLSLQSGSLTMRCLRDGKTGYFAFTTVECDGSHRSISLTKDRRLVGEVGFDTSRFGRKPEGDPYLKVEDKSLLLSTSTGIRIGMTPAEVQKKLGKPSKTAVRGKGSEYWCALYKRVQMEDKENGQVLRNTFIFKNSKLIEITLNLDSVPGCGDDSLSDDGWPWTKF